MKKLILAATFFYLFISPFYFHPDIKTIYYLAHFLGSGVLNIYDFISTHKEASLLGPFVYPPLAYYLFGILYFPINVLAGSNFTAWLGMGNDAVTVDNIYRYIFLIKLPIISLFIYTGVLLSKLVEKQYKVLVAALWFFNPISIYVVGLMGQFDVIPVFLTVLSLVLVKKKLFWAAVALGAGAAIKTYPLLLLPFLAITSSHDRKMQMKLLVIGLIPYLLSVAPFLKSSAFYSDTLTSGLSQRMLQLGLPVGFGEQILIVPAILIAFLFLCIYQDSGRKEKLPFYYLAITLTMVGGSHFHPQWALWALPFVALYFVSVRSWLIYLFYFVGFLGTVFLFNDKFLTLGLLSPFDSGVFFLPTPAEVFTKVIEPSIVQSIFHTTLLVSGLWIVWVAYKTNKYE